ncbi:MAG: PSD1 and planctomycete cytochrome C domain-containing protein [Planctomycetota bacterium]|nr:PSD1 and planctomycete cytochrome C domain-containing protein [Planctomycetota bacterium]
MNQIQKRLQLLQVVTIFGTWFFSVIALPAVVWAQSGLLQPDFNRDVRPILAAHCFACHGPDEQSREAGFRLDLRDSAVKAGVIVAGKASQSLLVTRIHETGDQRMPPIESNQTLSAKEKKILADWIDLGANYEKHWAFLPPQKAALPSLESVPENLRAWPANPIDYFVLAQLASLSKGPNRPADRYSLIRRVYLDLIGVPPTPAAADAFAASDDPKAYEKIVDELLKSKLYGEKWARSWLDLARYADTNGYEKDRYRSIWPWRDWVIKAINSDMPFDQFTIEQLAGDMLPNATNSQKLATGFHRNTMLNEEGGIDPLEYRFYAMVDRVATTGTIWLGLTTGCAQCHSHKYDPISHVDFYRMMALLNNADEPDLAVVDPGLESVRKKIKKTIHQLESQLGERFVAKLGADEGAITKTPVGVLDREVAAWALEQKKESVDWDPLRATRFSTNLPRLAVQDDFSLFASGDFTKRDVYNVVFEFERPKKISAIRLEVLPDERLPAGGPGNAYYEGRKGDFFLSELAGSVDGQPIHFKAASTTYGKISIGSGTADGKNVFDGEGSTGWSTAGQESKRNVLVVNLSQTIRGESLSVELTFERHFVASLGRFRISVTADETAKASKMPADIETAIVRSPKNSIAQKQRLREYFLSTTPLLGKEQKEIAKLRKSLPSPPMSLVLREREKECSRQTYRHHRGDYLDPREKVTGQLLSLFPGFKKGITPNRLSFAKWLVSEANPLGSRVAVNRDWQALFGKGLVETSGDFGSQGGRPTHPQLLDWLAVDFQEKGWSRKQLHRLIVTSSTYQQSSKTSPLDYQRDPANELLARGARFRVDAETVRDILLASSGKLSSKMFGPSVYPPQPKSVTALAWGNSPWPVSSGEDRYRRSLYTFSKRTAPFAAYLVFNSPTGENCVARRNRSNTPLQALTILNDEMYGELAQAAAELALSQNYGTDREIAVDLFRRFLTRIPQASEVDSLLEFKRKQLNRLSTEELKAQEILGTQSDNQRAVWTLVARALMSLDEVITKP